MKWSITVKQLSFFFRRNAFGIIFLTLATNLFVTLTRADQSPAENPELKAITNTHNQGGELKKWVVCSPFLCSSSSSPEFTSSSSDSTVNQLPQPDSSGKTCFDHDYIPFWGGENNVSIPNFAPAFYKDKNGNSQKTELKAAEFNKQGFISVDSLFPFQKPAIVYAYCLVESFIPCSVRCFWGSDVQAKVWVNGDVKENKWDYADTCLPLSKYFDTEFIQGINTVLLKMHITRPGNRFTFTVYDRKDSLVPFYQNIHSLHLELDQQEVRQSQDSITAVLKFNVPVPENIFSGNLYFFSNNQGIPVIEPKSTIPIFLEKPYKISFPDEFQGVIKIKAESEINDSRTLENIKFIWKGHLKTALAKEQKRINTLANRFPGLDLRDDFLRLMIDGIVQWSQNWFTLFEFLSPDEKIRQLGYIQANSSFIEGIISGEKQKGIAVFPLLLKNLASIGDQNDSEEYDPSRWLNYKYPKIYKLPEEVKGSKEYRFWLYLPANSLHKRKKIPLILSLHGAGDWGYNCQKIRASRLLSYAEEHDKFPFAVISPQCRYNTLWHAETLHKLLDILMKTGRFNRKRIYCTGTGMGGFATWHMANLYPNLFAAVVPLSSGGNKDRACNLSKVAVWSFHGARNSIVPLEDSQNMILSLKKCSKRSVEYTIFSEHGHDISDVVYYDPSLYKWLKKQKQ